MAERLFGLETEYAFAPLDRNGRRLPSEVYLARFMDLARERLPHLTGKHSPGIFLQNGSRLYVDIGNHPELATPEVLNPWDACRYVLAGEEILAGLANHVVQMDRSLGSLFLSACNFSYSGNEGTWACHESYSHRMEPDRIPGALIPHLVSRVIYTGSGGFNNRMPGIEFMVSPRAAHIHRVSSADSVRNRGIYHEKDETLSQPGFHRLHIVCGESVCSHTSGWLKVGTTAVVLAMIEAGLLGCGISLPHPLAALHTVAIDVRCQAKVASTQGPVTAREIQRFYLHCAEAHLDDPIMPPWAAQVCQRWRAVLDRLEHGPEAVATTLDWAIKLSLFRQFAEDQGIAWDTLPHWNRALTQLADALPANTEARIGQLTRDVFASRGPAADRLKAVRSYLAGHGLSLDQGPEVLALRSRLFEIDSRFSELGPGGIFAQLDQSGVLDHQVPGVDNIPHAVENPPAAGRARLRGQYVRALQSRRKDCRCDWHAVWDFREGRFLDLSDPFASQERWSTLPAEPDIADPVPHHFFESHLGETLADLRLWRAFQYYDSGRYQEARRLLEGRPPAWHLRGGRLFVDFVRLDCWLNARLGGLEGETILERLSPEYRESVWGILDYVTVYRFRGLRPHGDVLPYLRKGLELLRRQPDTSAEAVAAFREHHAYCLMAEGHLNEARQILEDTFVRGLRQRNSRLHWRAMATLGEVYRRLGLRAEARACLDECRSEQSRAGFFGEMAEFTLNSLAKLASRRAAARELLAEAQHIQQEARHGMGQARTLLLGARWADDAEAAAGLRGQIERLRRTLPALAQCPLAAGILARWHEWTDRRSGPDDRGDDFWGV